MNDVAIIRDRNDFRVSDSFEAAAFVSVAKGAANEEDKARRQMCPVGSEKLHSPVHCALASSRALR